MAELAHGTQPEFWRPPTSPKADQGLAVAPTATNMAEACPRCATEYLLGSHFCHSCGRKRPLVSVESARPATHLARFWQESGQGIREFASGISLPDYNLPGWLRHLSFHEIKSSVGLSTAAFVSLLIGIGCVIGALLVGLLPAKTLLDWQAIQFYRAEWLLAATASFVAGILLKNRSQKND